MNDYNDPTTVSADVKIDLHPSAFGKHATHRDPAIGGLARAAQAEFAGVYERLASVPAEVRAIREDKDLSLEAKHRRIAEVRESAKTEVQARIAKFAERLDGAVARYQQKVDDAVGLGGDHSPMEAEVRSYVRSLPTEKRLGFVEGLIERSDRTSLAAILKGERFLSGLDHLSTEDFTTLVRTPALAKLAPEQAADLAVVVGLRDQVRRAARIAG